MLYIDLNGFKEVNDTHGHAAGDLILIQVAKRLQESLRNSDTVARMGGDEFIMLVEEIMSTEDAAATAQRVLDAIKQKYEINHALQIEISASIGISVFPDHGEEDDSLVSCADQALYNTKRSRKGGFSICDQPRRQRSGQSGLNAEGGKSDTL